MVNDCVMGCASSATPLSAKEEKPGEEKPGEEIPGDEKPGAAISDEK